MKFKYLYLLTFLFLLGTVSAAAQSTTKVVVIDTEAFIDPAKGIKRLARAYTTVEGEFKPRRDEIAGLQTRLNQLLKEIDDTKNVAAASALQQKANQAEGIKRDLERKQQDGQRDLDKRMQTLTMPIYQDISNALSVYAKAKGYDLVFDVAKLQGSVFVVNESVDITAAFIADYNTKNP